MLLNMKRTVVLLLLAALVCVAVSGCKRGGGVKAVRGVLEGPAGTGNAPDAVKEVLKDAVPDDRYELIFEDKDTGIRVWGLMRCSEEVSAESYGVVIACGEKFTAFPDIRHGNMPRASYDASSGRLTLVGADVEGTGVLVERPWIFTFAEDGKALLEATVDPFELQQSLCGRIGYSVKGKDISMFADGKPLSIVTVTENDMGGLWEDPVWIGEQISYDITGPLKVTVTPGVSYIVGKVLDYDVIPPIEATVNLAGNSFSLDF